MSSSTGCLCDETETARPSLSRKRKAPKRYKVDKAEGYHSPTVEEQYRLYYFETIDLITHAIDERFDQPGYGTYRNLEELLLKAANGDDYSAELKEVTTFCGSDLKVDELTTQLTIFTTKFASKQQTSKKATLGDVFKLMQVSHLVSALFLVKCAMSFDFSLSCQPQMQSAKGHFQ